MKTNKNCPKFSLNFVNGVADEAANTPSASDTNPGTPSNAGVEIIPGL
jgi:hypothetical protein